MGGPLASKHILNTILPISGPPYCSMKAAFVLVFTSTIRTGCVDCQMMCSPKGTPRLQSGEGSKPQRVGSRAAAPVPRPPVSQLKLEFPVDLDRNAVREFGKPDGGARMLAVLRTQQLVEEIRCAVDHLRHPVESRCHIDHSHEPHDTLDAFELAKLLFEAG